MAAKPNVSLGQSDTPPPHLSPQEMSHEQLKQWEQTGDAPPREPATELPDTAEKAGEAAAPEPDKQAASTDVIAKAAPETAEPQKTKAPGQKLSAKERSAQIDEETRELQDKLKLRKALREELAGLDVKPKSDDKTKREPSPAADAAKEPAWKKYRAMPDAPKAADFTGDDALEDWAAALGHFIAKKTAEEQFGEMFDARSKAERATHDQDGQFAALVEETETRVSAELAADPTILDRIPDRWKALNPSDRRLPEERLTPAHFVKDRVTFHSRNTLKLSEWLCADGFKELHRIAQLDPAEQIREIAYQDAAFGSSTGDAETADKPPQPGRVSKAPAPPTTLGRKAATAIDPLKAAIAGNDYLAFEKLENDRELASRR